ncbi:NAD-dependent epimerase/dehydratase family protein, partial [Microbacteriaceae bacterium K1510]|nr:NAD-dependent epimerase/dehydratase family protein [Microbacteriaceae bacterium K1510]
AAKRAGARAFAQIGSSAEYAPLPEPRPIGENDPPERERLYGATKVAGSLLLRTTAQAVDLPYAVLRLFNIFGPGEKEHRLLPSLARALSGGKPAALSPGT